MLEPRVITPLERPFKPQGGIAVLKGNLAPNGAVLKPSAATPALMKHKGRAVVFEDIDDSQAHRRPGARRREDCVLVLKNCGPRGYPGFPEVGNFALPTKLLKKGVTDMVRISDARMSGTAYGTVVLHTAPEAAAGGPLALVRNGDIDRARRREARGLHLDVSDAELAERQARGRRRRRLGPRLRQALPRPRAAGRQGVDLDFLVGTSGAGVGRPSH